MSKWILKSPRITVFPVKRSTLLMLLKKSSNSDINKGIFVPDGSGLYMTAMFIVCEGFVITQCSKVVLISWIAIWLSYRWLLKSTPIPPPDFLAKLKKENPGG